MDYELFVRCNAAMIKTLAHINHLSTDTASEFNLSFFEVPFFFRIVTQSIKT